MSQDEFDRGIQIGEILTELRELKKSVDNLKKDIDELKNTRSKFFMALAWASGLGLTSGALGGKIAHIAGWLDPK